MFEFFYTKDLYGLHRRPSSFGAEGKFQNWILLSYVLGELWGNERRIEMVQDFIKYALSIDPDENYIGFDGASIEEKDAYFAISYEWAGDVEFLFPKEKFKQFMDEVEKASEEVYSKSRFESPDRVKFKVFLVTKEKKLSRITIDIPEEDHKQFKIMAAIQGKSMREIIIEDIKKHLKHAKMSPAESNE